MSGRALNNKITKYSIQRCVGTALKKFILFFHVAGRLYRCVRCPTAYHVGDFCLAAGSVNLGGYHILCSNHFTPVKTHKHHQRINVSWCFSCSKGRWLGLWLALYKYELREDVYT
jgi:hypothetical protein